MSDDSEFRLLVPFSFTKKSEMALDYALRFHRDAHVQASVYLFYVHEDPVSNFRKADKLNEEYLERMKDIVIRSIDRLKEEGFSHSIDSVFRRIANGRPSVEILKMAGGMAADMIIMGAPRSKQVRRLVEKAPCTLVLVKEKDPAFVMV